MSEEDRVVQSGEQYRQVDSDMVRKGSYWMRPFGVHLDQS